MASVIQDPNNRRRIQFVDADGRRRTIRLGDVALRQATAVKIKVEALLAAMTTTTSPDPEVSQWVAKLDDRLHEKLSRVGLVAPRQANEATLETLLDAFFGTLAVKDGTATTYKQTRRSLEEYFGATKPLDAITALDADRFARWLKDDQKLAGPTISKRIKTARQVFKRGTKWGMIAANPFSEVKAGSQTNRARMFFITSEVIEKVIDAAPNAEWRAIIALSRYGGLRCPSEHLALRWHDIDWAKGKMTVWSSKTEGHDGREYRIVPLFPELRRHLMDAFERAQPGAEYVISRYRLPNCNLRSQLLRIMARAGVPPWERLFHNLRSSRQTELCERFPTHVVCGWLGNSPTIAAAHYLQSRESDYEKAIAEEPAIQAAQIAAQSGAEPGGTEQQSPEAAVAQGAPVPRDTAPCRSVPILQVTPTE